MKRILSILFLTTAAFLASGCTRPGHAAPQARPLSVDAVRIQRVSTHQELRTYSGTLEAHRTTEVAFELDGIVESVLVDEGAQVDTGSPLAKLDTRLLESSRQELMARRSAAVAQLQEMQAGPLPEEIAASRAEVDDLKARLALMEAKRARRQILVQKNATSNDEYEEFIHGVESAQAQFQSAQKRLEILLRGTRRERVEMQQAVVQQLDSQISQVELRLRQANLIAPYAGRIARRRVDEGQVVSAGQPILRLVEPWPLEARIRVPADAARNLSEGQKHAVRIGAEKYDAKVASISPELDLATRCVELVLQLESGRDQRSFPGELVEIELIRTVDGEGVWLPSTALVGDVRGLWSCFVLEKLPETTAGGTSLYRTRREDLLILYSSDDRMLVRTALPADSLIVMTGVDRVAPGQLVVANEHQRGDAL